VELALRKELTDRRLQRRVMLVAAVALTGAMSMAPRAVLAEGLFDFLFGGAQKQQARQAPPQASFFADPNQPAAPQLRQVASSGGSGPAFCVRSCDGRYFPLARGNASPVQMCQAFCPASATKVFYGSHIDSASSSTGERYADSENAFAYRKALRADCTCNGRDSAGLAPVDLTLDTSLRSGDVIATTDGLVAYSGVRVGNSQTAEFTPVASYPGLTADVRARLGEMKVAPVAADTAADALASAAVPSVTSVLKAAVARAKRAEVD
jgi:hypothetical protein